jgi:hypothetical protein
MTSGQRKWVHGERARLKAKYPDTYERDYANESDEDLLSWLVFVESIRNPPPGGETVIGIFPTQGKGSSRVIKTGPTQEGG